MTHVKQTKDSSNEYDDIFVLKHEANYEGVVTIHSIILNEIKGHRFQEQIYIVPLDIIFMLESHGMDYTDPRTKKAYRFDIDQYAHHRRFLDKKKLASHPFVTFCANLQQRALVVVDCRCREKKIYMLDPINKNKKDIPESIVKLNKFVYMKGVRFSGINNFLDEGLCWGGTLNGGWRGRRSRVYHAEWSTYREGIDGFRYEYGPHILLHEMNKIRDQVIWACEVIRLPKPSAALSSPYCKFSYVDLESK
ncbi:hypothetical protein Ahy_A07g034864 isoform B [Arachis hypogaea]|uniref:Uncharacterized protein n=1 Tax=Arachis hypogaea TaxID=3818 RepID=A0A445CCW5_ARAHY|nr:hypothetical protein Ahy_A07g034864 isoform B [Arachis hypogaea]